MGTRLFVIDGSPAVRRMVEQVSSKEGYEVHAFPDGPSALRAAKNLTPQTVIADFHLDKITFSSFCKELGKLDNMGESSIISLVDSSDKVDESTYRSLGVAVFLTKPLEPGNLIEALRDLSSKHIKKTSPAKGKRTWPPVTLPRISTTMRRPNLTGTTIRPPRRSFRIPRRKQPACPPLLQLSLPRPHSLSQRPFTWRPRASP